MAPCHAAFPLSSKESYPAFCVDSNQHTKENMRVSEPSNQLEICNEGDGEMLTATELGQKVSNMICC